MVTLKFWNWFKRNPSEPEDSTTTEIPEKGKIGDPPIDETVQVIPYGKRLKKVKIFANVFNGASSEKVSAKIIKDWWIKFKTSDRVKHEKMIGDPPKTHEYTTGKWFFKRRIRELVFYVGYNAEVTHDPARCQYDIPIIEGQIKMAKSITKGDILKAAADQVKAGMSWMDLMLPGMFFVIILFLIFAFQVQPNL